MTFSGSDGLFTRLLKDCDAPLLTLGSCLWEVFNEPRLYHSFCLISSSVGSLTQLLSGSHGTCPERIRRSFFSSIHNMILPYPNLYTLLHMNSRSFPLFSYIHKPNLPVSSAFCSLWQISSAIPLLLPPRLPFKHTHTHIFH